MATVDEYLASVPSPEARAALESIRAIVREEFPEAVEVMSYGIPGFKHHGYLLGYAAFKNHCSLFPGGSVASFADRLAGYKLAKGTIQFLPSAPLPEELIREIVRIRAADNLAKKKAAVKR
jgi:uncharacterized protein YdhG (YjbR/CyaY superfamily)